MTADPIDRMIELLAGFAVHGDENGSIELRHRPCRSWLAAEMDDLGALVRDVALTHAAECPGPAPAVEEATAQPCGSMHTGRCVVLDREPVDGGEWVTYEHDAGQGRVFNGELS